MPTSTARSAYAPQPAGGVSLALTATSAVRRYEGGGEFLVVGHSAGATMSWALRERTSLAATGAFTYMPSYSINATPLPDAATAAATSGTLPANALDYSLTRRTLFGTVGGVTLSHNLSRRLNLGIAYSASRQEFELEDDPSYLSHSMSGRLTYSLTRGLGVRAGFGRRLAYFSTPEGSDQIALDDLDVGLVFTEAVGITRTTRLSFSTGSSIRSDEGERSANLIGTATLSQELGRRGQIALSYNRGQRADARIQQAGVLRFADAVRQLPAGQAAGGLGVVVRVAGRGRPLVGERAQPGAVDVGLGPAVLRPVPPAPGLR